MNSSTKIDARRMLRMRLDQSSVTLASRRSRPRTNSGITRSLEIMIDSATLATMTMAVAADSPPMKAAMAMTSWPLSSGSDST